MKLEGTDVAPDMFQSLFYWNDLLSSEAEEAPIEAALFQSLFYWNDLLSSRGVLVLGPFLRVSILVLLE